MSLSDLRLSERLRELDLRNWLNDNSAITTIAAVVLLMVALGIMLMTVTGGGGGGSFPTPTHKYFYDLNTGELFPVPLQELPPIERGEPYALPNGQTVPAGVEAMVFGPVGASPEDYVIGWVETLPPERRDQIVSAIEAAEASDDPEMGIESAMLREQEYGQRLVMDPKAAEPMFYPRYSEQGQVITSRSFRDESGEPMRLQFPD